MISRRSVISLVLVGLVLLGFSIPACSAKTLSNLPEPEYASQVTEDLLLAVNAGDYAAFSRDFDASMLKAIPATNFTSQFSDGIKGQIGDYQAGSKRFFQASRQAEFSTVIYYVVYSNEPGAVQVQISFRQVEGKPQVSGLFFNSPKLRK